jgi:hypothetical protein
LRYRLLCHALVFPFAAANAGVAAPAVVAAVKSPAPVTPAPPPSAILFAMIPAATRERASLDEADSGLMLAVRF